MSFSSTSHQTLSLIIIFPRIIKMHVIVLKKFQISGHRKGPRPSTNTTSMYEKSTTHVNRTYSRTYWFIYRDSRTEILYYYTQLVLMNCTSVYTTHILIIYFIHIVFNSYHLAVLILCTMSYYTLFLLQ